MIERRLLVLGDVCYITACGIAFRPPFSQPESLNLYSEIELKMAFFIYKQWLSNPTLQVRSSE
jgi:hypothetical protein